MRVSGPSVIPRFSMCQRELCKYGNCLGALCSAMIAVAHLFPPLFSIKVLIADKIPVNQMVSYADHLFQGTNHSFCCPSNTDGYSLIAIISQQCSLLLFFLIITNSTFFQHSHYFTLNSSWNQSLGTRRPCLSNTRIICGILSHFIP